VMPRTVSRVPAIFRASGCPGNSAIFERLSTSMSRPRSSTSSSISSRMISRSTSIFGNSGRVSMSPSTEMPMSTWAGWMGV
jgi:hypothetical protein